MSAYRFLETHPKSTHAVRFWTDKELHEKEIHSYPLYAIAKVCMQANEFLKEALEDLCEGEES